MKKRIEAHLTTAEGQKVRITPPVGSYFRTPRAAEQAIKTLGAQELTAGATKITGTIVDRETGAQRRVFVRPKKAAGGEQHDV